jgi:hypothetical protein
MPNMTLAIPTELKKKMDRFKEINWSEVARQAIQEKIAILEKMNQLLSKSQLTEADIDRHAAQIKKSVLKKHKAA